MPDLSKNLFYGNQTSPHFCSLQTFSVNFLFDQSVDNDVDQGTHSISIKSNLNHFFIYIAYSLDRRTLNSQFVFSHCGETSRLSIESIRI